MSLHINRDGIIATIPSKETIVNIIKDFNDSDIKIVNDKLGIGESSGTSSSVEVPVPKEINLNDYTAKNIYFNGDFNSFNFTGDVPIEISDSTNIFLRKYITDNNLQNITINIFCDGFVQKIKMQFDNKESIFFERIKDGKWGSNKFQSFNYDLNYVLNNMNITTTLKCSNNILNVVASVRNNGPAIFDIPNFVYKYDVSIPYMADNITMKTNGVSATNPNKESYFEIGVDGFISLINISWAGNKPAHGITFLNFPI